MLNLTGTNAKSQGAKGTVCGGMAVTADDGGAGEGEALLRSNDMDNSLALVAQAEICQTELLDVLFEGNALCAGIVLLDEGRDVLDAFSGCGGDILHEALVSNYDRISTMDGLAVETYVIGSGQGAVRSADLAAGRFETLECLL